MSKDTPVWTTASRDGISNPGFVIGDLPTPLPTESTDPTWSDGDQVDSEHERGSWGNKMDFLFSIMGSAVGLGSIWRFPYLVYRHGGGFIFVFFICMFLLGLPLFLLEILIGQYSGLSLQRSIQKCVPMMKGVGFAGTSIVFFISTYYCVIIAWTFHFFISSFLEFPDVVWNGCNHVWNDLQTCVDPLNMNYNISNNISQLAVDQYWQTRVLRLSTGIEQFGTINPDLAWSLLAAWILVYFIIWKGLHAGGKIIWFTAIFPYTILIALFIQSVMLDGAADGLLYYVTPNWDKLADGEVWIDGGTQVVFSFCVGSGGIVSLGSYNKFHHNSYRDAWIVGFVNPLTAFFAGCITFAVLGYLAKVMGVDIEDVVTQGPGLTFVIYPQVLGLMKGAAIWSILFFFMLLLLGINSQFTATEALIMAIVDEWPSVFKIPKYRYALNLAVCFCLFLLGLTMVTNGGMYVFQLVDSCALSGFPVVIQLLCEIIVYVYGFGVQNLRTAFQQMLGKELHIFWIYLWRYLNPAFMIGLLLFYSFTYTPVSYGSYEYPRWGVALGVVISIVIVMWIPLYAIHYIYKTPGTLKERFIKGLSSQEIRRSDSLLEILTVDGNSDIIKQII